MNTGTMASQTEQSEKVMGERRKKVIVVGMSFTQFLHKLHFKLCNRI